MEYIGEVITSRNNPFVKWAASLTEKKGRSLSESFLIEGEKLSFEALEYGLPVSHIIVTEAELSKLGDSLYSRLGKNAYAKTELKVVSKEVFEKISTEKSPQGIISIVKYLDFFSKVDIIYKEEFLKYDTERVLFLCSVRDPGNLGAVIRCAAAFGIDRIIMTNDCADIYSPRTVRAAMGSLFRLKITVVTDPFAAVEAFSELGRRVLAAELRPGALALGEVGLSARDVIMIGNEGHGIPAELSSLCSASVYIPISENTESLNASSAATVFMWEQSKLKL